jgi:hypothetical protein
VDSVGSVIRAIVPSAPRGGTRARARPYPSALDSPIVSHPSLGLPPPDMTAGFPAAAARLVAAAPRVGARALEVAIADDPTLRERHDEIALRRLLRDTEVYIERIARSLASNDPGFVRDWADQVAPVYRRRRVPMDDLVRISEGLRLATKSVLAPGERGPVDEALDAAVSVFRKYRRIAGDARKRNRILAFIYKGA